MHTKKFLNIISIVILALAVLSPAVTARAQAGSASDLINAVNTYRAQYSLEAYQIDGGLMSLAQSHSDYQASIQTCTHQRADGSGPANYGISAENIACGNNLSVQDAIYYQWRDALHLATLTGPSAGLVGAGVSTANSTVYYTLAVKRLSGEFEFRPPVNNNEPDANLTTNSEPGANQTDPNPQISPIETSPPNEDGSISHIVKYGQTLTIIAAAYGIPLSELIAINQLDPNNPAIFEGQPLLIRIAFTETPFMTLTFTPRPPTRTPLPTRTPRPTHTNTPILSPTPTRTATVEPLIRIPTLEEIGPARPILAYAAFGISLIALIALVISSFWPGDRK